MSPDREMECTCSKWTLPSPLQAYLVRPDTLSPTEAANAPPDFHVLVRRVHLPEALANVRHHPPEHFAAEDHARAAHAEVLPWLQAQLAKLCDAAQAGLSQVERFAAVQRSKKLF